MAASVWPAKAQNGALIAQWQAVQGQQRVAKTGLAPVSIIAARNETYNLA